MIRICFIGASTTEGMGDATGRGWPANLRVIQEQKAVCYNLGVRAQTVFDIEKRAEIECAARIPNYDLGRIVLGCPVNELPKLADGSNYVDTELAITRYKSLIQKLGQLAPVVVVGPPPVIEAQMPFFSVAAGQDFYFSNTDIQSHDRVMQQLCEGLKVPYLSVFAALQKNEAYQSGLKNNDGLHTDSSGYRAQAAYLDEVFNFEMHEIT